MNTCLLIIDPQNDFCDENGSLYVNGANDDMWRVSEFIEDNVADIDDIYISLDCHVEMDISHSCWYSKKDLDHSNLILHPAPFSTVTYDQVNSHNLEVKGEHLRRTLNYLKHIESLGKKHTIWPTHCIAGRWGMNICDQLKPAIYKWKSWHAKYVNKIVKGLNPFTEQLSAFTAVLPIEYDSTTYRKVDLIYNIRNSYDQILVCGEAASHCVAETTKDLVFEKMSIREGATRYAENNKKIVLLEDGMSSVKGFEHLYGEFKAEMTKTGASFKKMKDVRLS
jgi:nicotinamidase-related amidase